MKQVLFVFLFVLNTISCDKTDETPLLLPSAAEPSAKINNDRGVEYFHQGKYLDALIAFTQASVADNTAGEIHFNLALMQYLKGKKKEAKKIIEDNKKKLDRNIEDKKQKFDSEIEKELAEVEKEIKDLKKSSTSNISKIAVETSADIITQIIDINVNKSNVSAIVNDIAKRKMEKHT